MPTVLITGAASGIGRSAAQRLARDGWQCVLVDREAQGLSATLAGMPPAGNTRHRVMTADLTNPAAVEALAGRVGTLDALINNAGMSDRGNLAVVDQDDAAWHPLVALNLDAPARLVQAFSSRLVPGARIVNVASGAGLRAIPWRGAYSASKAGLIAMSRALARERDDWCVTTLCPGFVRTALVDSLIATGRLQPADAVAKVPLGRIAEPEDMAEMLTFLASEDAAPVSGLCVSSDGGSSVFGGSRAFAPATQPPVPLDMPVSMEIIGASAEAWQVVAGEGHGYRAVLDVTPLDAAPGQCLEAVRMAARRFRHAHAGPASLTLMLPPEGAGDWRAAADAAAARMLVATLACEWGAEDLRINAVQAACPDPHALAPLLRFMAGPRARYMTGQVLPVPSPPSSRAALRAP